MKKILDFSEQCFIQYIAVFKYRKAVDALQNFYRRSTDFKGVCRGSTEKLLKKQIPRELLQRIYRNL